MYPILPSPFLQKTESLEAEFLRVSRLMVGDVKTKFTMAAQIEFEKFEGHCPETAALLKASAKKAVKFTQSHTIAASFKISTMPNHAKLWFVPLSLVSMFGMPALSLASGRVGILGAKGVYKEVKDKITGEEERIKSREALELLDDKSNPQKHLILDVIP